MKPWYRSRTLWLNIAVAGASAAIAFLPPAAVACVTVMVAMANVVLRYDTSQEIQ